MSNDRKGLTLLEIIIIIVIMSLLASFALPNFGRAALKADEREAIANLIALRAAVKLYKANARVTAIPNWVDTDAVNQGLGLGIVDTNVVYSCGPGNDDSCAAVHSGGWTLAFHGSGGAHNTDGSIHCDGGACPSCPGPGSPGCG